MPPWSRAGWSDVDQESELKSSMRMRMARLSDVAVIEALIERSVMALMGGDYSEDQRRRSIGPLFGVDRRVIEDGTYFLVEAEDRLVGAGGWSFRRTLFGGDAVAGRDDARAAPGVDPAHIRAYYVDPNAARGGIATALLLRSEMEAARHGFTRFEMGATLTGRPFYARHGYREGETLSVTLPGGLAFPIVRMTKEVATGPLGV